MITLMSTVRPVAAGDRAGDRRDRGGGGDRGHDRDAGHAHRHAGRDSVGAVEVVRDQTAELGGIGAINDSGVRILHSARALRKVAVGK